MFKNPDEQDFKSFFVRDFPYQPVSCDTELDKYIQDCDIQRALLEVECQINSSLFTTQEQYELAYLYFAAHYLVTNIQASGQGIEGSFEWNQTSKSVGSVSVAQSIPESILMNPYNAWLTKTSYGAKYLMMILPKLTGVIFPSYGATKA